MKGIIFAIYRHSTDFWSGRGLAEKEVQLGERGGRALKGQLQLHHVAVMIQRQVKKELLNPTFTCPSPTMQSQKKHRLLEGLIQAALLLSLCGLMVDVELEPEPQSLLPLGPTSALTPAMRLHNLRNTLESDPKQPDLELIFTSRRLLGWVRSLDRLQVPQTELETWLVQQEPTPLPIVLLHTAPNRLILPEEPQDPEELRGQGWEPEDIHTQHVDAEEQDTSPAHVGLMETEETQDQNQAEDQLSSSSLWECLHLLEDFPLMPEQQEAPADMEQQWQDLLDLMEPQAGDMDMEGLLEQTSASEGGSAEGGPLIDDCFQHGARSELLPLLPSDQLDKPLGTPPVAPPFLLDEADLEELSGGLEELLGDGRMLEDMSLLDLDPEGGFGQELGQRLEEQGYLDPELTRRTSRLSLSRDGNIIEEDPEEELDSDSGLSLDSSHSPSPSDSDAPSSYSSSSSTSSSPELEVTVKEEPLDEEELGAVGGHYLPHRDSKHVLSPPFYPDHKLFDGFPRLEQVSHNHTYNQPSPLSLSIKSAPKPNKPHHHPKGRWSRDERRARGLKIPFSNDLIVRLPVEEFNDLLTDSQLSEDQLNLVRDIRRRGKNKIAAQNCRKRKMDTLHGLEKDVATLRRRKSRLMKDKQEALRTLQELKQRLSSLYQDVFSSLRDEEGQPLDVHDHMLSFQSDGSVDLVSRRRRRSKGKGQRPHKDDK